MKKIYYLFIALASITLSFGQITAQSMDKDQFSSVKEARQAARAAHKLARAEEDQALYNQAVQALKYGSFVIEVDQLVFPRGMTKFVSSLTNFVSMNDGQAIIQIATSNFYPGQNGLGGITVSGNASNITMSTDKHGIVYYNFVDQGIAVSATVNVQLIGGSNRATVTVYPNFSNNNLTLTGIIVPYSQSDVFQGQTI
ncbi:MAG: DUF4251 domain-containing protein [Bacteroidales bacterium]